jgi:tRNA dimethylallyltransferase
LKQLIVIQGPTAVGKTSFAIQLAKKLNTVIISADSRQFYKEMSIGTAKPDLIEQAGVKHYFTDSHSIFEPVSAAQFEKEALEILVQEFKIHDKIILVGGSGLFIDALCDGLDEIPTDKAIRNTLNEDLELNGIQNLLEELKKVDLECYDKVDKNNPMRIIRALEVNRITGKKYSDFRVKKDPQREFKVLKFVLDLPRPILYDRINQRVDVMIQSGLENEAKNLHQYKHLSSLNTVGYSEFFDYFEHKITYEKAIELIKQNSRRYAKRQITWFKRDEKAIWLNVENLTENIQLIEKMISL